MNEAATPTVKWVNECCRGIKYHQVKNYEYDAKISCEEMNHYEIILLIIRTT